MELKRYNVYFLFLLLAANGILIYLIFKPFLIAILTAAVLAVVFRRPYRFFVRIFRTHTAIASLLTCILVAVTIIIPVSVILGLVVREANTLYQGISSETGVYQKYIAEALAYLKNLPFAPSLKPEEILGQKGVLDALRNLSQWLILIVRKTYQNIMGISIGTFVMFFTLFYFFMDGEHLVERLLYLSPLKSSQEELLLGKFVSISRATLKGALIIGILQGLIGGITFAVTGVPSPVIWTILMIILSMIPLLGSGLVWFPVGVVQLLTGNIWQGIVVLGVGIGIISTIDNLLRPRLVGHDIQMHPLLVFFATFGGIAVFGIAGFILGPILTAFFLTLLEIYAVEFKHQLDNPDNA